MTMAEKVQEARVRRHARRLGLRVEKSRARLFHVNDAGLWQLLDGQNNVVAGARFDLTLDALEGVLAEQERRLRAEAGA
jgi:hypothetical protein